MALLLSHPMHTRVAFDIFSEFASSGNLETLCVETAKYFHFHGPLFDLVGHLFDSFEDLVETWSRCPPALDWDVISSVSVQDVCDHFHSYFPSKNLKDFFSRRLSEHEFQHMMLHPGDDHSKLREILRVHGVLALMLLKKEL